MRTVLKYLNSKCHLKLFEITFSDHVTFLFNLNEIIKEISFVNHTSIPNPLNWKVINY